MLESVPQIETQRRLCPPFYRFINELRCIQTILKSQTPLVAIKEINSLRALIAKAAIGEYFLIQSGDCANNFYDCDEDTTYDKLEFIEQVAAFFQRKTGRNVLLVGQMAEFGSTLYDTFQNERAYSYFDERANPSHKQYRISDLWRMLLSYHGFASIYQEINHWNRALNTEKKIHTSHETLFLYYEQAFTRLDKRTGFYYNCATHFPWLSNHTFRSMEHMSYLKKIANPLALKIGPDTSVSTLIKIINQLDPDYIPGRITLIPQLGVQQVHRMLPQLIDAVKQTKRMVLWSCDPMSGNTETLNSGRRIRKISNIVEEIKQSFLIHRTMGSQLNAIHLEATHQNVAECVDYTFCRSVTVFNQNHQNLGDLRLNYAQAMHIIRCVAKYYAER